MTEYTNWNRHINLVYPFYHICNEERHSKCVKNKTSEMCFYCRDTEVEMGDLKPYCCFDCSNFMSRANANGFVEYGCKYPSNKLYECKLWNKKYCDRSIYCEASNYCKEYNKKINMEEQR